MPGGLLKLVMGRWGYRLDQLLDSAYALIVISCFNIYLGDYTNISLLLYFMNKILFQFTEEGLQCSSSETLTILLINIHLIIFKSG